MRIRLSKCLYKTTFLNPSGGGGLSKTMKVSKTDWNKVPVDPDKGFSADHNNEVIADVIDHTDRLVKRRKDRHSDELKDRSWAVAKYLKNLEMGGESDMTKYFGKREMARLQGEKIMAKLKSGKLDPWAGKTEKPGNGDLIK